jgi:hypothetical protein
MKKTRKKRDIEIESYDLLQTDHKIKNLLIEETKNQHVHEQRLEEITLLLKSRLTYRDRTELEKEQVLLSQKLLAINNNTLLSEYIALSHQIVEDYSKLILVPENVSFFAKPVINKDDKSKDLLIERFLEVAKKYIPIKSYRVETTSKPSCECGNSNDFTQTENSIICDSCGGESYISVTATNYRDIDRVNLSQKYKYNTRVHFRDQYRQYMGIQNKKMAPKLFSDIDNWLFNHRLLKNKAGNIATDKEETLNIDYSYPHGNTEFPYYRFEGVTKGQIYMALNESHNNCYYEDINLLHHYLTGIPCPNISHIETELFQSFDQCMASYNELENVDRTNFLNGQYVLYQLLRLKGVKVEEDNFDILKTRDRLISHDEIWEKICFMNEWKFLSTL